MRGVFPFTRSVSFLVKHDLLGKPVSTLSDHALGDVSHKRVEQQTGKQDEAGIAVGLE